MTGEVLCLWYSKPMSWSLYILRCKDGTLYTGITTNVPERLAKHQSGEGAKYTRGRGPFELVYCEKDLTESAARKREAEIKKWSKMEKEKFLYAN